MQEVVVDGQDVTLASELPADAAIPLMPEGASQPMLVEAVITWNPSAEAAEQEGVDLVNGCRMMGGTELVDHPDGNPESAAFTVQCDGGVIDGLWCAFGVGLSTCFFEPGTGSNATASEPSTTAPTEAPMPADASTPTQASTQASTEAPMPTATVSPTDEPVIEPTFVDPTVEPTLPQLEPWTPTPVILT